MVSNLIMADYRQGEQRVFAAKLRHRMRRDGDGFRMVWKKVELVNADGVFDLIAVRFRASGAGRRRSPVVFRCRRRIRQNHNAAMKGEGR